MSKAGSKAESDPPGGSLGEPLHGSPGDPPIGLPSDPGPESLPVSYPNSTILAVVGGH